MSSAQAAAAAAFSGTKAPAAPAAHKRRPSLRLRTNLGLSSPKTPTPGGSVGPETPGSRTQASLGAPSPPENKAKGGRAAAGTSTNTSPASPPAPAPRQPPAAQNDGAYTPGSGASRATRGSRGSWSSRGPRTPMGAGEDAGALGGGYFGLPRSASVSLHDGNSDTPRAARSASTKPQDMLEQVRSSISAKSKSGTQKDAARKSQLAVSEFRQRVDSRMVLSQPAPPGSCSRAGADEDASSACSSGRGSESGLFFHPAAAQSRVSVGSAVSDASADAPDSRLSCPDGASLAASRKTPPAPSPIPIPLSSQGVDRGLAAAPEGLAKLSLAPGLAASASSESVGDPCLLPAKPGRKKPPSSHDCESVRETSGSDIEYSGPGLDASDFDTDDSESVKFPLFPGLSSENHHHHRIGLFSKKKTKRDRGVVYDPEPPRDDASELSLAPAPSPGNSLAVVHQPVKLRSTMRKKDKRKERKTAFNEDKPWKNHGDLDVISDSQRKRYEGLWVSNKGLYLDRVATKLLGVDYERQEDSELSKSMREYSEREISERAAQLSASLNVDFDSTDARELHGLDCVSMSNLIHGSVVKKLWSRSNLPRETLQAIWDLVDFRKDGTLNKAEFIVGMWLVDQRLYGRKLPKVVNKSVWSSLGGLGVNVVIKKKRR